MTRLARRQGLPPSAYTEKEWQHQVENVLTFYGWDYRFHIPRARMVPWGWPDIVAVRRRDRRLLFAELKTSSGVASPEQLALLELLLDVAGGGYTQAVRARPRPVPEEGVARVDVELWRPGDIDRVQEVLR